MASTSLYSGLGTMVQLLLLLILLLVATPSDPSRQPRATYSRPSSTNPAQEKLYGYDCLARPDKTQVFSMSRSSTARCKSHDTSSRQKLEHKVFDVFQYQRVAEVSILSCSMEISRFQGTCGTQGWLIHSDYNSI